MVYYGRISGTRPARSSLTTGTTRFYYCLSIKFRRLSATLLRIYNVVLSINLILASLRHTQKFEMDDKNTQNNWHILLYLPICLQIWFERFENTLKCFLCTFSLESGKFTGWQTSVSQIVHQAQTDTSASDIKLDHIEFKFNFNMMLFALHYANHKTELCVVVYLPQAQTDKRLECVLAFATETY